MIRLLSYVCLLSAIVMGCKKVEEPQSGSNTAQFSVEGSFNSIQKNFVAGNDGYYMYTNTSMNAEDVNYFTGRIARNDCNNCGEELIIRFRGNKSVQDHGVIMKKRVDFTLDNPQMKYGVQFNSEKTFTSRANSVDYTWSMGDGVSYQDQNPYHLFNSDQEFYDVSLNVETSKGVPSSLKNRIYTSTGCKTWFDLVHTHVGMRLVARHTGATPSQYFWEFEDGHSASVAELDYDFEALNGSERICLTITDENGCVSQSCQNLIVNEDFAFTAANFEYEIEEVLPKNGFDQFNTVSIEYINEKGELFVSSDAAENGSFQILGISEFPERNEYGNKVMRVQFLANCPLVSAQGNSILLENVSGYFGVAIPE